MTICNWWQGGGGGGQASPTEEIISAPSKILVDNIVMFSSIETDSSIGLMQFIPH